MRKDHQHADVDIGDPETHRLVQQAEERRLGAPRHGGKRRKGGGHREDRRQREEPLVGALRPQLLLHQQLQDVGERLQQAVRPDQVRAVALLHEAHDLALGEHQQRRRVDQHEEREADDRQLDYEAKIHVRLTTKVTTDRRRSRKPILVLRVLRDLRVLRVCIFSAPPASDGPRATGRAACSGLHGRAPRTRPGTASSSTAPAWPPRRRTRTASCRRCCWRRRRGGRDPWAALPRFRFAPAA